jgi:hypothetical protein
MNWQRWKRPQNEQRRMPPFERTISAPEQRRNNLLADKFSGHGQSRSKKSAKNHRCFYQIRPPKK